MEAKRALRPSLSATAEWPTSPRLIAAIAAAAQPGDHVLIMSNGGFGGIHEKLLTRLGRG